MMEQNLDAPAIAIVRSPRGWAKTLHRYVVDYGGAIVKARPLEERQAIEADYDILVVDDVSSFLNNHIIDQLHRLGRLVLGVYDAEEFSASGEADSGHKRLTRLGVDAVIEAQATPEQFVRIIEDLAPRRQIQPTEALTDGTGDHFGELDTLPGSQLAERSSNGVARSPLQREKVKRGVITAVIGASGGAGATEVAIELAHGLARRGERTVLVDGDELAPTMAQRLSLALHPNLRTAVDVVEHGSGRLSDCLVAIAGGLEVLVGLPHPRDWVEIRGTDLMAVVESLSRHRPQVVINASPMAEDLTSYGGPDRFGMSRSALEIADQIVLVCAPTPMGVARLIDRAAELTAAVDNKPFHVVVNRVPKGPFKRNEIAYEIRRSMTTAGVTFLPADPRTETAGWEGTLVTSGEFTKAIETSLLPAIPASDLPSGRRSAPRSATQRAIGPPAAKPKPTFQKGA